MIYRRFLPAAGRIFIDGVDIGSIGLRDLRSKLVSHYNPQGPGILTNLVIRVRRLFHKKRYFVFKYTARLRFIVLSIMCLGPFFWLAKREHRSL